MFAARVAVALLLCAGTLADLPVHCVHRDILGKWTFHLGDNDGDASATCGHHVPDRILTMVKHYSGPSNPPFKVARVLDVELKNPNIAVGPSGSLGTWTIVYDEGIEVILDGWKYFTFFRYTPKRRSADPSKSEQFNWICHETVPGWYHPVKMVPPGTLSGRNTVIVEQRFTSSETGWGCFVGEQRARAVPVDAQEAVVAARNLQRTVTGPAILSSTVQSGASRFADAEVLGGEEDAAALLREQEAVFLEEQAPGAGRAAGRRAAAASEPAPLVLADLASSTHVSSHDVLEALHTSNAAAVEGIARRINSAGGLWKARVPTELLGSSTHELRARLGASSSDKVRVPSHSRGAAAASRIHGQGDNSREDLPLESLVGGHRPVVVDIAGLPAALDWATKDGGIYMPAIVDQRACGSCYAVSAVDALTVRARIRSPALAKAGFVLSAESVVRCSIFNQGCEGGYPYLVGKSVAEVGIVEDQCMPYTSTQATCPTRIPCEATQNSKWWRKLAQPASTLRFRDAEGDGAATPLAPGRAVAPARGLSSSSSAAALLEVGEGGDAVADAEHDSGEAGAEGSESDLFSADAAADAELAEVFGGVGPLGLDETSPHFRERVPRPHKYGRNDAAMEVNPFATANGRLRISRYEYVGGYYGACHETSMLAELQKGPLIVAFNSPGSLYMYKTGIFTHSMAPDVTAIDVTPISRWEKTNHAVLLVGYGVEDGVKYWKLRNSWGTRFGEDGYFRMVRGVDMLAAESMAVVIDI